MNENIKISPSLEDYLETIYFLQKRKEEVRVTDVAIEMSISKPSVNKAIKLLKSQGLVYHEHYGHLTLTEKGKEIAGDTARRHMIIKKFLVEMLKVDEETAELEACKLEHSMSMDTMEKLAEYIESVTN